MTKKLGIIIGAFALLSLAAAPAASAVTTTEGFNNGNSIATPNSSQAIPYPATGSFSGLGSPLSDVNVSLEGFTNDSPVDVDVMLVSPSGEGVVVMSDTGCADNDFVSNIDLNFDDSAAGPLPQEDTLASGTYLPTDYDEPGQGGDANCPDGFNEEGDFSQIIEVPATSLSAFNGEDPNGTWSLYILDDEPPPMLALSGTPRGGPPPSTTRASVTVVTPVPSGSTPGTGTANKPQGKCKGKTTTIFGTRGNDKIEGTPERDIIQGSKGKDVINGLGGNDLLCGGDGNDRVDGGPGVDTAFGGANRDLVTGGAGKDRLFGGSTTEPGKGSKGDSCPGNEDKEKNC